MGPPAGRIGAIPTLPIFFKLRTRRVLLAGASPPAVWKAELLAASGADVLVCDPMPSGDMEELAKAHPDRIAILRRRWTPEDLTGAALAVGALEGAEATEFRDASRAAGVPVNIVDVPELCDFQFGTIVERSPLLLAISTDGAAPVLGQALRTRIEALLPETIGRWAEAAAEWRPTLQERRLGFAARRRFWEVFAERALDGSSREPAASDFDACLDAALHTDAEPRGGLWLVGTGPGEADQMTLAAVRALQSADIIVHEVGLGGDVLALGRREASRIAEASDLRQTERDIATWIATGKTIAWAARGDPDGCACWRVRRDVLASGTRILGVVAGLGCENCPDGRDIARPDRSGS